MSDASSPSPTTPDGPVVIPARPNYETRMSAMAISQQRRELADKLRAEHPGVWAVVSNNHVSRGSARQVRDRIKGNPCWAGFEWSVHQHPDNPELHRILAKAPVPEEAKDTAPAEFVIPSLPVVVVPLDEISPTF